MSEGKYSDSNMKAEVDPDVKREFEIVQEAKKKHGWIVPYDFYNTYGGNYFGRFLERNPEFNTKQFIEYVIAKNRGDRDSGELQDVAKFEILRLASEYEERMRRFPNAYGDPKDRIPKKEPK